MQLDLIVREIRRDPDVTGRWLPTAEYPYYYNDFIALTDISTATRAYFEERERGTWSDTRITYAKQSYTILTGEPPGPGPEPPGPTPTEDELAAVCLMLFSNGRYKR